MRKRVAISDRHLRTAACLMLAGFVAFRSWVCFGGFFYSDDYRLVREARRGLSLDYLLAPYDAQFMPFGRLVAWFAAQPEQMSWPLLAAFSVTMAACAAVACLWMLVTLSGWRPQVLAIWAFYLTNAMVLPAFLWWAAALNQLPLQVAFFLATGCWVRHLRGWGRHWAVLTLTA
ncbi:MAG: hypothetical protein L0H31_16385, partial [Nocardioidaceae bacterium]|nr:hypothetical protein [Nocardioidaceae bacterium]